MSEEKGIDNTNGGFDLVDFEGKTVNSVRYMDTDVTHGTSAHFQVVASSNPMLLYKQKSTPSAGVVEEHQRNYDKRLAPIITCMDETIACINEGKELNIPYT